MTALTQEEKLRLTYRQIADDITERIQRGEYPAGAALPTYKELAELYSVSQATASRAYGLLRDRGTVVGEPGRGMFVPESPS